MDLFSALFSAPKKKLSSSLTSVEMLQRHKAKDFGYFVRVLDGNNLLVCNQGQLLNKISLKLEAGFFK